MDTFEARIGRRAEARTIVDDCTVVAYVNHGRWVANCPNCNGGIPCFKGEKLGVCPDCRNGYEIQRPDKDEVKEVERLLSKRSTVNRNWFPHETVEQLKADNLRYGVKI